MMFRKSVHDTPGTHRMIACFEIDGELRNVTVVDEALNQQLAAMPENPEIQDMIFAMGEAQIGMVATPLPPAPPPAPRAPVVAPVPPAVVAVPKKKQSARKPVAPAPAKKKKGKRK